MICERCNRAIVQVGTKWFHVRDAESLPELEFCKLKAIAPQPLASEVAPGPKCVTCGEVEDHMNHHADYSMDGSWHHQKDHDFAAPTEPQEAEAPAGRSLIGPKAEERCWERMCKSFHDRISDALELPRDPEAGFEPMLAKIKSLREQLEQAKRERDKALEQRDDFLRDGKRPLDILAREIVETLRPCDKPGSSEYNVTWVGSKLKSIVSAPAPRPQEPRCPRCGGNKLRLDWNTVAGFQVFCEADESHYWDALEVVDFSKFFSPAQSPQWISVSERLPEAGVLVLVYDATGNTLVIDLESDGTWASPRKTSRTAVTHWQPLPAPPAQSQGAAPGHTIGYLQEVRDGRSTGPSCHVCGAEMVRDGSATNNGFECLSCGATTSCASEGANEGGQIESDLKSAAIAESISLTRNTLLVEKS